MKRLFYILFCFNLFGCSDSSKPQKPANLLRKEKMVQILADIHTVEAQVERAVLYPDTALMTFNHYQQEVIDKHGVSEKDFRDTYRYYLVNLPEMTKLYEIVIDTLSIREIKAGKSGIELAELTPADAGEAPVGETAAESGAPQQQGDAWRCKLLLYSHYPLTAPEPAATMPYYLSPALHDLAAPCAGVAQVDEAPAAE